MKGITHRFKVIALMPDIAWTVVTTPSHLQLDDDFSATTALDLTVGTILDYDATAQMAHTEHGRINCPLAQMQKCVDKKYVEDFSWFEAAS